MGFFQSILGSLNLYIAMYSYYHMVVPYHYIITIILIPGEVARLSFTCLPQQSSCSMPSFHWVLRGADPAENLRSLRCNYKVSTCMNTLSFCCQQEKLV